MNVKHFLVIGGIALSFAATSAVLAEQTGFSSLDADGDDYISAEEAGMNPMLKDNWDSVDTNKDGKVEKAEFSAFEEKSAEPRK